MHDIEYILKYTLDSSRLKIESLEDISNNSAMLAFRKKFEETKKIMGFTAKIGDTTIFPLFNVPLNKDKIHHNVKYCEVAIGDSVLVTKEYALNIQPPDHYGSFIINMNNESEDVLMDDSVDPRNFAYVIKDQSRIHPLFDVKFEYDEEFERKSKGVFLCERCKIEQSVAFCPSERANFCEKCDEEIHSDDFHKRHDRYYFNQVGKKRFIYCGSHPESMVKYYCEECSIPICYECKINGNHSKLPYESHPLIEYLQACDKLQENIQKSNVAISDVSSELETCILEFKGKAKDFKQNVSEVRQKIEDEYKMLMSELNAFENSQFQTINAIIVEKMAEYERLMRIKDYPLSLEPSQLVRFYNNVRTQRETLNKTFKVSFTPKLIDLKGKMYLGNQQKLIPRKGYSPRMDKTTKLYVETRGSGVHNGRSHEAF